MAIVRRLITGFLSQSSDPVNISIPWQVSNQDGMFKMNRNLEAAILDDLKVWAKTNWGERPMRFRFGLDARRHLFEPIRIAREKILENAREQLPVYFSFLQVEDMNVFSLNEDDSLGENEIRFFLKAHFKSNTEKKIIVDEKIGL